jgi:uroporphyrinogen-III decarboxylase
VRVLSGITFPGPDYDLAEVCRNFEGKVTLVGGLSPHFLATAGIDDIKDTAKRILDITAPYSNFILGTADDVVYGTPIKNLEVVAKIANDFRK